MYIEKCTLFSFCQFAYCNDVFHQLNTKNINIINKGINGFIRRLLIYKYVHSSSLLRH